MEEKKRNEIQRFLKFGVTGGLNTLVDFVVYTILTLFCSVNLYAAQVVSYLCGTLNSYLLNRSWTFHSNSKFFSRELLRFIVVNAVTLGLSLVALAGLKQLFPEENGVLLKVPVVGLTLVVNFILSRLWVFRGK